MFLRASSLLTRRPAFAPLVLALSGCSGTDIGYPRVSDTVACADLGSAVSAGGSGVSVNTGGAAGSGSPTSAGASSGSSTMGVSGSAPGGAGGVSGTAGSSAMGGAPVAASFTWPDSYDATLLPTPADGHHNVGASCMSSTCHGTKVPFVFGGTVYKADGMTGAANVEVGISDGALTVTTYSASNGNIWLPSSAGSIDFAAASIAIRNGKGERVKPATAPRGAACNGGGCHGSTMRLLEP